MSKGCCAALVFALLALVYLYQIIILVFVVPIQVSCDSNSTIPEDPAINLSMESWIYGGMIAGVVVTAFSCASSRSSSSSDCMMVVVAILYILYNFFTFIWSIIGIVIYDDYYEKACQLVDNYQMLMHLAFYSGLVCSSILIFFICLGCCFICKEVSEQTRAKREKLLDDEANNVVNNQDNEGINRKQKIRSIQNQEEVIHPPMNDAQQQRQRTLFGNIYNRIVGENRRSYQ